MDGEGAAQPADQADPNVNAGDQDQTEEEKYGVKPDDDKAIQDAIDKLTEPAADEKFEAMNQDEKYGVKPDNDKAIKDKITELTGTKKTTEQDVKLTTPKKNVEKKSGTHLTAPNTGVRL